MARRGRLVLIVDPDLDFVEDTRLLLEGERTLAARSLDEGEEIVEGGRVDVAVLGPSFGNQAGVRAAGRLLGVDPTIRLVLAANVVTNRVLLAALQTGLADVVDTPLTVRKLQAALAAPSRAAAGQRVLEVVVEPAPAEPVMLPAAAFHPPAPAAEAAPPMPRMLPPLPPTFAPSPQPMRPTFGPEPGVDAKEPPRTERLPAPEEPRRTVPGERQVIVVMAGKGGSGKSVVATNLAVALTFVAGEDAVAIVDADLQFGDVALLLQMDPLRNLADVASQVEDLPDARLDALLMRHESGLRVLPAPERPVGADTVSPKAVVQVMETLRRLYPFVVVDTGGVLDDTLLTLLDHADEVIVVVDMDLPSVKNTKVALEVLRSGGYPMERLRLVVNRIRARSRLDLIELERSLGLRTAAAIPSDRLVPQSVNEGVPVVALSPRSRVARAFTHLARQFLPGGGRRGS